MAVLGAAASDSISVGDIYQALFTFGAQVQAVLQQLAQHRQTVGTTVRTARPPAAAVPTQHRSDPGPPAPPPRTRFALSAGHWAARAWALALAASLATARQD